ncbi:single-stranded-DNA-specific exonuclease RecJ [Priestia aryabhattai]|uniref:single-stranded-DNA-specific exonuclease RecJ n=1 Tax=Priestia aryabhattai TaxID=412384 RepID=UPI003D2D4B72
MNNIQWISLESTLKSHPLKTKIHFFSQQFLIDPILMHWLFNQGFDNEDKLDNLFFPSTKQFHDPFLLNDMKKAVYRIVKAIRRKEKIMVFGDYDGDGITATTILVKALMYFEADVSFRLPLRSEGYGITSSAVQEIAAKNISLIITVDNGSSAHEAMKEARKRGIDVIVTDHHDILKEHPDCYAFINPKRFDNTYPFNDLCGAGVALKVVESLFNLSNRPWYKYAGPYLELATIGTIADLVSLRNENRVICHFGLKQLNLNPQPVLKKLFQILKISHVDSSTIGFQIAPILNAVGRVDDPNLAVGLLLNPHTSMNDLKTLVEFNKQRKNLTNVQYQLVEKEIAKNQLNKQNVIVVFGDFNKGIIGILASRISDKFKKPSIVISSCGTGSCRGVNGTNFSMIKTLERCSHFFLKYGGHQAAAGFSVNVDCIPLFKEAVQHSAKKEQTQFTITKHYLSDFPIQSFSKEMANDLEALEPYGMGFKKPVFQSSIISPQKIETFGMYNEHFKFKVGKNEFLGFGKGPLLLEIKGKSVHFLYTLNSSSRLTFLIEDIKV